MFPFSWFDNLGIGFGLHFRGSSVNTVCDSCNTPLCPYQQPVIAYPKSSSDITTDMTVIRHIPTRSIVHPLLKEIIRTCSSAAGEEIHPATEIHHDSITSRRSVPRVSIFSPYLSTSLTIDTQRTVGSDKNQVLVVYCGALQQEAIVGTPPPHLENGMIQYKDTLLNHVSRKPIGPLKHPSNFRPTMDSETQHVDTDFYNPQLTYNGKQLLNLSRLWYNL